MTRRRRRQPKRASLATAAPQSPGVGVAAPRKYAWMPLWGWVLIFALPLIASEFMFYMIGHWGSMVLFPVAWIGFWATMLWRTDWAILRRHRKP